MVLSSVQQDSTQNVPLMGKTTLSCTCWSINLFPCEQKLQSLLNSNSGALMATEIHGKPGKKKEMPPKSRGISRSLEVTE